MSDRKRKKQYVHNNQKKGKFSGKKKFQLQADMRGFLATLNDKQEKQATTELLNILPDFMPELEEVEEIKNEDEEGKDETKKKVDEDDVAAMLAAENKAANLLQFCNTLVPNIVFIKAPSEKSAKNLHLSGVVSKVSFHLSTHPKLLRKCALYFYILDFP